jgi:hypothetical protein
MEWKDWIGKRIFIKLISGDCYTGQCCDVDINNSFIEMLDKYGNKVTLAISQITKIVENGK